MIFLYRSHGSSINSMSIDMSWQIVLKRVNTRSANALKDAFTSPDDLLKSDVWQDTKFVGPKTIAQVQRNLRKYRATNTTAAAANDVAANTVAAAANVTATVNDKKKLNAAQMKRWEESIGRETRDRTQPIEILGQEGKDGMVVKALLDGRPMAIKVFKKTKSPDVIAEEVRLQQIASEIGVAPPIVETQAVSDCHRAFAMPMMHHRLLDIVNEQSGLTNEQAQEIIRLYQAMGSGGLLHNDSNVGRNIMSDSNGKLWLIDFGFSKEVKPSRYANHSMLCHVNRMLKKPHPLLDQSVREAERATGRTIDVRRAARERRNRRSAARVKQLQNK